MSNRHSFKTKLIAAIYLLTPLAVLCCPATARSQATAPAEPQDQTDASPFVIESQQFLGAFVLRDHVYTITSREKQISPSRDSTLANTMSELQISDETSAIVYEETFSDSIENGHFGRKISAAASILRGGGGSALVIRFLQEPAATGESESWEIFTEVNGRLTPVGLPLPLGQGGSTVGGVVTGVMVTGGIAVAPLISTAEALRFRVWTGHFFVDVPMRMNWPQGEWSEAEECFELSTGTLRERGCNMQISATPDPPAEGAVITLYSQPVEDSYRSKNIPITSDSHIDYLLAQGVVNWEKTDGHLVCRVENMWLQIRIAGVEGWVHSDADLAAIGLPATKPPQ